MLDTKEEIYIHINETVLVAWSFLLCNTYFLLKLSVQTALAGPVVERRVRENVTLACPPLEDNDGYNGIIWNKGPAQFVTVGKNQEVKYATDSLAERVSVPWCVFLVISSGFV